MNSFHLTSGTVHFIGIGGIGMSGLAEILYDLNCRVQGSDIGQNQNITRLEKKGIKVFIGHDKSHIKSCDFVVVSSAIHQDNPEILAARKAGIPILPRRELLSLLCRMKLTIAIAGTHGKTTTTSLIASMLRQAQWDPTVISGGIMHQYNNNAYLGKGPWMVVEADESDGTFLDIPASACVVSNIDPEHLDYWKSFDRLRHGFEQFVHNIPFTGIAALCADNENVRALMNHVPHGRFLTYGFNEQAHMQAHNIRHEHTRSLFDVCFNDPFKNQTHHFKDLSLPIPGDHNIQNALGALCIGIHLGLDIQTISSSFSQFQGVERRFTCIDIIDDVQIIDDYGHHPREIEATLKAARQRSEEKNGRVIAVVQPHRYSRLKDLFSTFTQCFHDAHHIISLPVFSAGEEPLAQYTHHRLIEAVTQAGHPHAQAIDEETELFDRLNQLSQKNDLIVFLGAGSISQIAHRFTDHFKQHHGHD